MFYEMDRKLLIILILALTNILSLGAVSYQYFSNENKPQSIINNDSYIYVHILGEVTNPKVYQIKYGTRLFELIELSGGETELADLSTHNLSLILEDEMKITINKKTTEGTIDPNVPVDGGNTNVQPGLVNINTASLSELMTLNGIGEVKAQNILDYRNRVGKFYFIEDIMIVSGIGDVTFDAIKDHICI